MAERSRIAQHFAPLAANEPGSFHLTDDAAQLIPPPGYSLVITTDSVIEGIHAITDSSATLIAEKLVRRNLSDLAAMGAKPWRYLVNLHTPVGLADAWFAEFAAALNAQQTAFGMVLAGGDSTSGGSIVHATMTCIGLTNASVLLRSMARAGEDVYVSGTIGGAALGLDMLQAKRLPDLECIARYEQPEPRIALGQALVGLASSAMDISDGLLADAQQLATASHVCLSLQSAAIPLLRPGAPINRGDDYELLFTAPTSLRGQIDQLAKRLALPLTRIGSVAEGSGVLLDGQPAPAGGWEHA